MFSLMVVYIVLCSMTGVRNIGIWFFWLRVSLQLVQDTLHPVLLFVTETSFVNFLLFCGNIICKILHVITETLKGQYNVIYVFIYYIQYTYSDGNT